VELASCAGEESTDAIPVFAADTEQSCRLWLDQVAIDKAWEKVIIGEAMRQACSPAGWLVHGVENNLFPSGRSKDGTWHTSVTDGRLQTAAQYWGQAVSRDLSWCPGRAAACTAPFRALASTHRSTRPGPHPSRRWISSAHSHNYFPSNTHCRPVYPALRRAGHGYIQTQLLQRAVYTPVSKRYASAMA
jgi:hypothetical protein